MSNKELTGFNLRLAEAIRAKGFSNNALAQTLSSDYGIEMTRSAVGDWVHGRTFPQLRTFYAVCVILGISADNLLFGVSSQEADERVISARPLFVGLTDKQKMEFRELLQPLLEVILPHGQT